MGIGDRQHRQCLEICARAIVEPHHDRESPISLEEARGLGSSNRGPNDILYIFHVQTMPRQLFAVGLHSQKWQARDLLDLHVGGSRNFAQQCGDPFGRFQQAVHVVAKHLHRHVRTNARDQLVESHLDGLGEFVVVTWKTGQTLLHLSDKF